MMAELLWPRRAYFITLQSNLELPVIRHLVRLLGGIPIPRGRRMPPRFHKEVLRALEEGAAVPIYPEGSCTRTTTAFMTLRKRPLRLPMTPTCRFYRCA